MVLEPAPATARSTRAAGLSSAERKVLREALLALAAGQEASVLDLSLRSQLPAERVRESLATLEAHDCIGTEGDRVRVAYPFTLDEVPHQVISSKGVTRTCCAVDALGVGAMLDETVEVRSVCSYCGAPIRLQGKAHFEGAPEVVVFLPPARAFPGKAIDTVCPSINFYCDVEHGRAHTGPWADRGRLVSLEEATSLGVAIFGNLLSALEKFDG